MLSGGGSEVMWQRVETPAAMQSALERQPWEAIVSDDKMAYFSGLAALGMLRAADLDVPFIIVSGAIGEDVVVAAMKAEAHDYLMKGRLACLVPALERELCDVMERRNPQDRPGQSRWARAVALYAASPASFRRRIFMSMSATALAPFR